MSPPSSRADLEAKFAAPVATHVLARPRLQSLLSAGLECPVTVVAATAGWGKTLLVGSWIATGAADRSSAWITLDKSDDDTIVFWSTLAAALLPVAGPGAAEGLRGMIGGGADPADLPGALAAALRHAAGPLVLVLDNLHEVTSPEIHAGLLRLIERPLPELSLLVTTRRDPPWPLQRLRLAGLVAEVRANDLAFRPEETADLFTSLGLDLEQAQLELLVGRTEGWAAGLRLLALKLLSSADVPATIESFSGNDHSVAGYLLSEVLNERAPALVTFLERISVVDLVSAELADALTGRDDGAAMLAELAASHLFMQAVGRPGRWYRLHRLIIDLLRARLSPPRERRDLHRRAAEWFRNHGMPLDALDAAMRGQLWPLAADLTAAHVIPLVANGTAQKVQRLLAAAPPAVVLAHPELAAGLAVTRVMRGRTTDLDLLTDAATGRACELSGRRAARLQVLLDLVAGARSRLTGDLDLQLAAYRRVPVNPTDLAGLGLAGTENIPVAVHGNRGAAALWTGDLEDAESELAAAANLGGAPSALPHLSARGYLALLECERGELDQAETTAEEVVTTASSAGFVRTPQVVGAYLALARLHLDRGDLAAVDQWLGRVEDVEAVSPEPQVQLAAALILAEAREAAGDRERALAGLRATAARLDPWTPPRLLADRWLLAEAALLAHSGDTAKAEELLGRATPTANGAAAAARVHLLLGHATMAETILSARDAAAHPRARVHAGVVGALVAAARDDEGLAHDRLEDALFTAAPRALRQPFLNEGSEMAGLLHERLDRGTAATTFALDLMHAMSGAAADPITASRALIDPLTERERTILRYLGSTLTNAEIAGELYLSVNTVKTHQRAVYRKLGADGRRDAVRRARALNLL
jgi:LuxR family maltose regulon positive regulatory protein